MSYQVEIGERIKFGEIMWRVLDIKDNKALLFSEDVLMERMFDGGYNENADYDNGVTWDNCGLRRYLNGEFYNAFSAKGRNMIVPVMNKNDDNPWYNGKGGADTKDSIFLLSLEEIVHYFGDSGDLKNRKGWFYHNAKNYADSGLVLKDPKGRHKDAEGDYINDQYNSVRKGTCPYKHCTNSHNGYNEYWLRTIGENNYDIVWVSKEGAICVKGYGAFNTDDTMGVRPALWLDLELFLTTASREPATSKGAGCGTVALGGILLTILLCILLF